MSKQFILTRACFPSVWFPDKNANLNLRLRPKEMTSFSALAVSRPQKGTCQLLLAGGRREGKQILKQHQSSVQIPFFSHRMFLHRPAFCRSCRSVERWLCRLNAVMFMNVQRAPSYDHNAIFGKQTAVCMQSAKQLETSLSLFFQVLEDQLHWLHNKTNFASPCWLLRQPSVQIQLLTRESLNK